MAAPEDLNVDELKRRARRRLVGAIVLALAVAVFVPILLESDPKPLGEDVSVKIPPIDEGKFVNRLNEKAKTEPAKTEPTKTTAAKSEPPKAEGREPAKAESREPVKAETAKAPPPVAAEIPKAEAPKAEAPKAEVAKEEPAKSEPAPSEPSTVAKATASQPPAAAPAPSPPHEPVAGEFSVQVFAFSDDKGANSLVNKLKKAGFPAYTEPVNTSKGTLWRVRVGPYSSRESASAARERLKGEGYNGIVAAAK